MDREIRCVQCGAFATAGCDCGVEYVSKLEYTKRAIEQEPEEMSNRVIAAKIRVNAETVRRARKQLPQNAAVVSRKGKDGKIRKLPQKERPAQVMVAPLDVQFEYFLSNLAKHSAELKETMTEKFGNWQSYPITHCTYDLIQQAARVWTELAARYQHRPHEMNIVQLKPDGGYNVAKN
jgi:DNA-binding transcriptional regulator YhcF (GntR family)